MARFTRRRYVRRTRRGRGRYGSRRRSRRIPFRRIAPKRRLKIHHYKRSLEGWFAWYQPVLGAGYWISSSNQLNLSANLGTPGSVYDPPANSGGQLYGLGASFNIGWTANTSELAVLYDQYKIRKVKVSIMSPDNTSFFSSEPGGGGGGAHGPSIRWYVDNDDATTPTTVAEINEFMQRPDIRKARLVKNRATNITVYPKIMMTGESGIADTMKSPGWINFSNTARAHYGLKALLIDMPTITNGTRNPFFRWRVDYYIACRDPR